MRLLTAAIGVMFLGFLAADGDDGSKADHKKMEGTWKWSLNESGGNKTGDEELAKLKGTLVVKGSEYTVLIDGKEVDGGKFTLDATKKPGQIDAESKGGEKLTGIYEVKGDTMRVCFAGPDGKRPSEFKTTDAGMEKMLGYTRVK